MMSGSVIMEDIFLSGMKYRDLVISVVEKGACVRRDESNLKLRN